MKNKACRIMSAALCAAMLTSMSVVPAYAEAATEAVTETAEASALLEDGQYVVEFKTDSSMFHVNEANEGKGLLTVEDGEMTVHIMLASDGIVNLFLGMAEDAKKDGADLIDPVVDTVTYSDGMSEEVLGYDVPVTVFDEEFDLALIGKKQKWYDHKVSVSDPVKASDEEIEKLKGAEPEEASSEEASDSLFLG